MACYVATSGSNTGTIINGLTIGGNRSTGYDNYRCGSVSVRNTILVNNTGVGLLNAGGGSLTENFNDLFGNSSARSGVTAGAGSIASNPGLKYILRTETGSPVAGTGEGGANIGANVTKRYQDGTQTAVDLWPWPNEARIKKEMCTDAGVTRGFCAPGNNPATGNPITLTNYVWEYLGNPYPGTSGAPRSPKPPASIYVTP
jgi:hypothetical protein